VRYLAFLIVMGLSITVVQGFDWPTWLQVVAVILVNLVAGAVIWRNQEEAKRDGESEQQ
jgi:membrane protein implicated in regulation of membrane protease activity